MVSSRKCEDPNRPLFASCQNIAELLLIAVPMRELRTLLGVLSGAGGLGMFPKWQPISTAPKDGTRILIFEAGPGTAGTVRVSCWRNDTIPTGWTGSEHPPSHWLPLPLPPNKESSVSADVACPSSTPFAVFLRQRNTGGS